MAVILDLYLKFSMISSHSHMDVFQMYFDTMTSVVWTSLPYYILPLYSPEIYTSTDGSRTSANTHERNAVVTKCTDNE